MPRHVRKTRGSLREIAGKKIREAEAFFYEWAGYSYDPKRETESAGRRRGAVELAKAEANALAHGWYVEWYPEEESYESVYGELPQSEEYWSAVLKDENGTALASLGFVDDRDPRGYGRVVEAELALEAMHEKRGRGGR